MKPISLLSALFAALLATAAADEGATLTVTVTNIPDAKGTLLVGVYDKSQNFTEKPLPQSPKIPLKSSTPVTAKIAGLEPGTYAVAVIQDLNGNGILDRGPFGMPREPLAFSVIRQIPRGKPSFSACSFVIETDLSITIPLVLE